MSAQGKRVAQELRIWAEGQCTSREVPGGGMNHRVDKLLLESRLLITLVFYQGGN